MTTPLILTAAQNTAIQAFDAILDNVFGSGVQYPSGTNVLAKFVGYDSAIMTKENNKLKKVLRDSFLAVISAMIATPGMGAVLTPAPTVPPISYNASYLISTGGTGQLTFTNGLLTGHIE